MHGALSLRSAETARVHVRALHSSRGMIKLPIKWMFRPGPMAMDPKIFRAMGAHAEKANDARRLASGTRPPLEATTPP
eukprot:5046173-Pyramimonas_sp.AAC.1